MSTPTVPDENDPLSEVERARIEAETAKLRAEALSMGRSGWSKPSSWLTLLAGIGALATSVRQCQVAELGEERARLEAERAVLEAERAELRRRELEEENEQLESQRVILRQEIERAEASLAQLEALTKEAKAKSLALLQQPMRSERSVREASQKLEKEWSTIQRSVDVARARTHDVQELLSRADSPTRDKRADAVELLIREHPDDALAIGMALEMLEPPRLEELTATGRLNLLLFLRNTERAVWSDAMVERARAIVAAIRRHGRTVGPQTEDAMRRLIAFLEQPP